MKNVQIIDGAKNCADPIYAFTDEQFATVFPAKDQNVELIEDVRERLMSEQLDQAFSSVWARPVKKSEVSGIHGTLFYELEHKKRFYPSKRESDVAGPPHSPA